MQSSGYTIVAKVKLYEFDNLAKPLERMTHADLRVYEMEIEHPHTPIARILFQCRLSFRQNSIYDNWQLTRVFSG